MGHRHDVSSWRDCRDAHRVERLVLDAGGTARQGATSHEVVTYNGQSFALVNNGRPMSDGVAAKAWKWLQFVGLVSVILVAARLIWIFLVIL